MVVARNRDVHRCALACAAGAWCVQFAPTLSTCLWSLLALPLAWSLRRSAWALPLVIFVAAICSTALRAYLILEQHLPDSLENQDVVVQGIVVSLPESAQRYRKFDLDVEVLQHAGRTYPSPGRVRLRDYRPHAPLRAGERWRLRVRLKHPHAFLNPGGFDYEAWLFRHRIRAVGYVRDDPQNRSLGRAGPSLHAVREDVRDRVRAFAGSSRHTGLFLALALGDRSGIREADREIFFRTGTSHLIAISGLHIGIVAGLAYWLTGLGWRWCGSAPSYCPAPKIGAAAGLLAATAYAAMAGFSIPTQRAVVMLSVLLLGVVHGRAGDLWRLYSLAMIAVLMWDPFATLDAAFWLSFGALGVILYLITGRRSVGRRWRRWLDVQLGLSVGIAPFAIALFQGVSLASPLANLIAVPFFSVLLVPAVLSAAVLSVLGPGDLGALVFRVADDALALIWPLLAGLAHTEYSFWWRPTPSAFALVSALAGALWLLAPRGAPGRWLGVIWLLPLLWRPPAAPAHGEIRATVLDVGQGLAVVVQTASTTMVYDTGARFSERFDVGRAVLVPFLRQAGVNGVDTLIVSHGDGDHIGGMWSLLRNAEVKRRLSSVPHRVPLAHACVPGRSWRDDGVHFSILSPLIAHPPPHNDASCVIRVSGRFGSVLLTGDIESRREAMLVETYGGDLRSDVLLVPHQGSKTSSTPAFLSVVRPEIAVVASGRHNPYGHPHAEILDRYRMRRIPVYSTARSGAVTIVLGAEGHSVETYRDVYRRYWRR